MTTIFKKFATGTAALALMTTVFASGAMAAPSVTGDSKAEIEGSEFNVSIVEPAAFTLDGSSLIMLNGQIQTVETSMGLEIINPEGTGSGWQVKVSATEFAQGEDGAHPLDANALTFGGHDLVAADGASESSTISVSNDSNNEKIFTAIAGGGMGTYTVNNLAMELKLQPKEVYAGTYTSTITVALTTGP